MCSGRRRLRAMKRGIGCRSCSWRWARLNALISNNERSMSNIILKIQRSQCPATPPVIIDSSRHASAEIRMDAPRVARGMWSCGVLHHMQPYSEGLETPGDESTPPPSGIRSSGYTPRGRREFGPIEATGLPGRITEVKNGIMGSFCTNSAPLKL